MAAAKKPLDPIYARMLDVLREYVFKVQPGAKIIQDDIATYFNVNQNTISTWKSKGPSISPLEKLANEFNISLDWLILGKGQKTTTADNVPQPGYTTKDLGKLFVTLSYVSDIKITPILAGDPYDEIEWLGINLSIMPKKCSYFADNDFSYYTKGTHSLYSFSHGQEITIEDNRGRAIINMFHDLFDFSSDCDDRRYTLDTKNGVLSSIIEGMPPISLSGTFPEILSLPLPYNDNSIYTLVECNTY